MKPVVCTVRNYVATIAVQMKRQTYFPSVRYAYCQTQLARCALALLLASVIGCSSRPKSADLSTPQAMVRALASDELEGRGLDSSGADRAAKLIASRFADMGLKPLPGMADYFQNFDVLWSSQIDPATQFSFGDRSLKFREQFIPSTLSADGPIEGRIVFVGYGITSPEHHYDDYADMNVRGKVVLMMRFEPHDALGNSRFEPESGRLSQASSISLKLQNAADHGASGVILVNPPNHHGDDDKLMRFFRSFGEETAGLPAVHIKQEFADELLKLGSVKNLTSLQEAIDETGNPASAELDSVTVAGRVSMDRITRKARNVMAMLPGSGRTAGEYVVVGAHYDHLGHGKMNVHGLPTLAPQPTTEPSADGAIYNGADDNASGTAAMLAIADRIKRAGPPSRSIVFVAFGAEEIGLLGSNYFVKHPPMGLDKAVAMLNLDMVGRVRDEKLLVGGGGTALSFEPILRDADVHSPLMLQSIGNSGIGPSDHTPFAQHHIPVLFFFSGIHADYHRPTDDVEKINFAGLDQVIDLSVEVTQRLTQMPKELYVTSADKDMQRIPGLSGTPAGVILGIEPAMTSDRSTPGVMIAATVPDSPAAKARLKAGDTLVGFGEKKINLLADLVDALAAAKPGDMVVLKFTRGGKMMEGTAALVARP